MTRRKTRTAPPPPDPARWILAAAVLAVLSVVALRVHLADLPMERDEGEYAYGGQLLLRSTPRGELAAAWELEMECNLHHVRRLGLRE